MRQKVKTGPKSDGQGPLRWLPTFLACEFSKPSGAYDPLPQTESVSELCVTEWRCFSTWYILIIPDLWIRILAVQIATGLFSHASIQTNVGVWNFILWVDGKTYFISFQVGWTDPWYSGKTLSRIIHFRGETSQMSAVISLIILIDDKKKSSIPQVEV